MNCESNCNAISRTRRETIISFLVFCREENETLGSANVIVLAKKKGIFRRWYEVKVSISVISAKEEEAYVFVRDCARKHSLERFEKLFLQKGVITEYKI